MLPGVFDIVEKGADMELTYEQPDFLCVGCFGWARAKTAREAFRACRGNASPDLVKPEHRRFKVWRIPDQIDVITVDDFGGWSGKVKEGVEWNGDCFRPMLVFVGDEKTSLSRVPELPDTEL